MKLLFALSLLVASALGQDDSFSMPFGAGAGDTQVPTNDDGSSGVFVLSEPLMYFGDVITQFYLNTNGHLTYDNPYGTYYPVPIPSSSIPAMNAIYWDDIDLRRGGELFGRVSSVASDLETVSALINTCEGGRGFEAEHVIVATWHKVGGFGNYDSNRNSFQLITAYSESGTWTVFDYQRLEWHTTSTAQLATRGFNSRSGADGVDLGSIASAEDRAALLANTNCNRAGLYAYGVTDLPTPVVSGYTAVNTDTNEPIGPIEEGTVINLSENGNQISVLIETTGFVDSVVLELNGVEYNVEEVMPFLLNQNLLDDYFPVPEFENGGCFTLTSVPYTGPGATGEAGEPYTRNFCLEFDEPEVGLVLLSATQNADIELIGEDAVYSRGEVGRGLSIRPEYAGEVGSVVYYINGDEYGTKNDAPYQMSNLNNPDPSNIRRVPEFADLGTYTVLVEIMSGPDGTGEVVASGEATFTIVA